MFDIAIRLSRHSVRLMNELQRKPWLNTSSFVWIFSDYGCQNTEKSVSLTASDIETFLKTEENQNMERKIERFVFSGFGYGILAAENEIAQLSCLKGNLKANIRNI